jgi:hypothetical protein
VKRRRSREQDEADAREQAERRREALLADLRARQGLTTHLEPAGAPETEPPEPDAG